MQVYLRAFELEDYKLLNKWRNDDEILDLTCANKYFISSEWDKKWVEDKIFNNQKDIYLGICLNNDNSLIGYISMNNLDLRNRCAEWGGLIIGDKKLWNQGYATEAAALLLELGFDEFGLNRIYGHYLESHIATSKILQKLGFEKEGILRNAIYKKGQFHNQVIVGLLKEEYEINKASYSNSKNN